MSTAFKNITLYLTPRSVSILKAHKKQAAFLSRLVTAEINGGGFPKELPVMEREDLIRKPIKVRPEIKEQLGEDISLRAEYLLLKSKGLEFYPPLGPGQHSLRSLRKRAFPVLSLKTRIQYMTSTTVLFRP